MTKSTGVNVKINSTFDLMSRFEVDGANGVQADVSSITIKAWNVEDETTEVLDATLDKTVVVKDTLQTDGRWTEDSTGYNFIYSVADSILTSPGVYIFRVTITTSGGKLPPSQWIVTAENVRGS